MTAGVPVIGRLGLHRTVNNSECRRVCAPLASRDRRSEVPAVNRRVAGSSPGGEPVVAGFRESSATAALSVLTPIRADRGQPLHLLSGYRGQPSRILAGNRLGGEDQPGVHRATTERVFAAPLPGRAALRPAGMAHLNTCPTPHGHLLGLHEGNR